MVTPILNSVKLGVKNRLLKLVDIFKFITIFFLIGDLFEAKSFLYCKLSSSKSASWQSSSF